MQIKQRVQMAISKSVESLKSNKMKRKNKFKGVAVGLCVMAMAVGMAAATQRAESKSLLAGEIYVNTTMAGGYKLLIGSYDDFKCKITSDYICSYERTALEPSVILPANFNEVQAQAYLNQGLIVKNSIKNGLYEE